MDAFSLNLTLVNGLAFSLALGVVIFTSFYVNVRIWLQDFPAEVRAVVPPLSPHEKRQGSRVSGCRRSTSKRQMAKAFRSS